MATNDQMEIADHADGFSIDFNEFGEAIADIREKVRQAYEVAGDAAKYESGLRGALEDLEGWDQKFGDLHEMLIAAAGAFKSYADGIRAAAAEYTDKRAEFR